MNDVNTRQEIEHLLISVCIPVYNGAKYLEQSISSALNQQFNGDYEILIADDCSQDNSFDIAQRFKKVNPQKIRLIKHPVNKGLVANWNFCVREAKGQWIKFLFQDDLMIPGCLQLMYNRAMLDKSAFVICNRHFQIEENASPELKDYYTNHAIKLSNFFDTDRFISPSDNQHIWQEPRLYNYLGEPSCFLYNKSVARSFGTYNASLPQLCDYEYALRVVSNIGCSYVSKELVTFRVSSSSASSKNHSDRLAILKLVEPLLLLHLFIWNKYYKSLRSETKKKAFYALFKKQLDDLNTLGFKKAYALLKQYFFKFPFLYLHAWFFFRHRMKFYFGRLKYRLTN
ncbi:MAG TPA: glycosyltransferase family 2 protein [Parafilimonas sp.]|nr:glycosyltransferase family 2 protein [Parafilimonas sp.]